LHHPSSRIAPNLGGGLSRARLASHILSIAVASTMNELEQELAELIIRELNLEDIRLDTVSADTPLYGEGFGLDSIDILEIALLISKKYGFGLRSDNPDNAKIFATLGGLASYVAEHRVH
jgi:acyl carrier protein